MPVTVIVSNFNIANKIGQPNVQGEGHLIYYLDVTPPVTEGLPAVTSAGTYAEIADTSYTWQNVKAGSHFISIQLVNNDDTPLNPPVTWTEIVVVKTTSPSPVPSP